MDIFFKYLNIIQFKHLTDADGLARYDGRTFKLYQHDLSSNTVTSIYEAHDGTIWIGTRAGLNVLDKQSGNITRYTHDPADSNSLSNNVMKHQSFYEDSDGNMWIGMNGGLNRFDRKTAVFTDYQHNPAQSNSLISNSIQAIYPSGDGLWIGTTDGLDYFDLTTEQFTHYQLLISELRVPV